MQPEPTQDPETDPETETHELLKAWRESAVEFMNMNGHLRETLATQGHQLDELRADLKAIASEFDNIGTKFQGASLAKLILQPKKLMEAIEPLSQLIAKHSGPSA